MPSTMLLKPEDCVVVYHADCADGCMSAAVAYTKLGSGATYLAYSHDMEAPGPTLVGDKTVYILDFAFSKKDTKALQEYCFPVLIDHHETAIQKLRGVLDLSHCSINNSGAVLTWKYFYANTAIPEMVRYVQDRDLWRFAMPDSEVISDGLNSYVFDYVQWVSILKNWATSKDLIKQSGVAIGLFKGNIIYSAIHKAEKVDMDGISTLTTNSAAVQSEIAHRLAIAFPPMGICWSWDGFKGLYRVSLRSIGPLNVAEIAASHGGGGHQNAAGFYCSELPWRARE